MADERAVVLIIAHKETLSQFEKISLMQCFKILSQYPIRLISPNGLNSKVYKDVIPDIQIDYIDPKWQSSYQNFNRLKIDPLLYKRYRQYEYILFYELDAFVFRDELEDWCNKGYDFIGAPWFAEDIFGNQTNDLYPGGNGGFSLRKIDSHLNILSSFKLLKPSSQFLSEFFSRKYNLTGFLFKTPSALLKSIGLFGNNSNSFFNDFDLNEDYFWSKVVPERFNHFKVAGFSEAMKFSFELFPQKLYDLNDKKLPFGCHGYYKYDFDFYRPYINDFGYNL